MVLPKSKNAVGLGNSLMKDRFGSGKASNRKKVSHNAAAVRRTNPQGESYVTNPAVEASWVKMRSITEQAALDEFLSTAELAGTDFTAEKMNNIKIIHPDQRNPYLLSEAEERTAVKKQAKNRGRLTVPRRPKWNEATTAQQLDSMERQSFLDWRRGLAELQENQDLLITPFERNLEVWRQLWRVIERSDLIVQIVDARNPLLFRSGDLENYVKEVDPHKRNLLLVNKADMMTTEQRLAWADYFEESGINYKFFSASLAKQGNEALQDGHAGTTSSEDEPLGESMENKINLEDELQDSETESFEPSIDGGMSTSHDIADYRTRILTVEELEQLFVSAAPPQLPPDDLPSAQSSSFKDKITIGLVGYPNVGKSSTINALLGAKKVSVSATPGKTKHFQTLHLSSSLILCDCPGLVFPNFATTKAELVINGILPIDQLREFTGPAGLVAQRIPKHYLEAVYGLKIRMRPLEEGGTGVPTASELLRAYARARGFSTTGQGQPDESRAARYILKDYVNGKLLFCHPPPSPKSSISVGNTAPIDPFEFNRRLYDVVLSSGDIHTENPAEEDQQSDNLSLQSSSMMSSNTFAATPGPRSRDLDSRFFGPGGSSSAGHLTRPFNYQYTTQGQQKELSGRKERAMIALERGVDVSELRASGKKHFKGGKRMAKAKGSGSNAVDGVDD